ncbi:MAG: MoaD/ThiS family protein [Proteobacteria bacterium]|jgi:molybdopterin synthase sulfur carrier subunit|nr:MoaD/ThiS family protein [Pseudomonadota bacterium]
MAKVVLPLDAARAFANGETQVEVEASDVRSLLRALDQRFPGIGQRLRTGTAVAVDGEIFQDPYLEAVKPDSEVYFLPAIEGG